MNLILLLTFISSYITTPTSQQQLRQLTPQPPACTPYLPITQSSNAMMKIQSAPISDTSMAFFWKETNSIWYWQIFSKDGSPTSTKFQVSDSASVPSNNICQLEACFLFDDDRLIVAWRLCSGNMYFRIFDSSGQVQVDTQQFVAVSDFLYLQLACIQPEDKFAILVGKPGANCSVARFDKDGTQSLSFRDIDDSKNCKMVSHHDGILLTYQNTSDIQCYVQYDFDLDQIDMVIPLHSSGKSIDGYVARLDSTSSVVCYKSTTQKNIYCAVIGDDQIISNKTSFKNLGDVHSINPIGNSKFAFFTINSTNPAAINRKELDKTLDISIDDTIQLDVTQNFVSYYLSDRLYYLGFGVPPSTLAFIVFNTSTSGNEYSAVLCNSSKLYFPICNFNTGYCGCQTDSDCLNNYICTSYGSCTPVFMISPSTTPSACQSTTIKAVPVPSSLKSLTGYTFVWSVINATASMITLSNLNSILSLTTTDTVIIPSGSFCEFCNYTLRIRVTNPQGIESNFTQVLRVEAEYNGSFSSPSPLILDNSKPLFLTISKNTTSCSGSAFYNLMSGSWSYVSGNIFDPTQYVDPNDGFVINVPECTLLQPGNITIQLSLWFINFPYKNYQEDFNISVFEDFVVTVKPLVNTLSFSTEIVAFAELGFGCQPSNTPALYTWICVNMTNTPFTPCSDNVTQNIFGQVSSEPTLNIPPYFFTPGDQIAMKACVTRGIISKCGQKGYQISSQLNLDLQLVPSPKTYYHSNEDYNFIAYPSTLTDYSWYTNPPLPGFIYKNQMKVAKYDFMPNGISSLSLEIIAMNETHFGHISLTIPINYPPVNGTITVNPILGISLVTTFTIETNDWIDTDLPLSYMFCYSLDKGLTYQPIMNTFQASNIMNTILPAAADRSIITVKAVASDSLGATNEVSVLANVYSDSISFLSAITSIDNRFDQLTSTLTDPITIKKNIAFIFNELSAWENQYTIASGTLTASNGCPTCSKKGTCPVDRCECKVGWNYLDCSIPSATFQLLIDLKLKALTLLDSIENKTAANDTLFTSTLRTIGDNADFNSIETYTKIQDILEETLKIANPNTILASSQIKDVGEIVDDILQYTSFFDCHSLSYFTQSLTVLAPEYLKTLARSISVNQMASQNASVINSDSYEMFVQKISICDLLSKSIKISLQEPTIQINLNNATSADCNQIVNLQIYSFDANLMSCNLTSPKAYTKISMHITNENSTKNLNISVTTKLTFPLDMLVQCPPKCTKTENECICDDIGLLDIRRQFVSIFSMSRLNDVPNIRALLRFDFLSSIPFWILISNIAWLLISLIVLSFKLKDYDALKIYLKSNHKTSFRMLRLIFSAIHPMISVYTIYDDEISKRLRAYIYYQRTLVLMVFASIFNSGDNSEDDLISVSISFQGVNPYAIILPYLTVVPIFKVIDWLLHFPSETNVKRCSSRILRLYKIKLGIGIFFTSLLALSCNIVIIIIIANLDRSGTRGWTISYLRSFLQDMLFTPFMGIIVQILLLKLLRKNFKSRCLRRCLLFYREPVMEKLMNLSQVIPTRSDTDTMVTSPTQTQINLNQLKLKKATTFDFLDSPEKDLNSVSSMDSKNKIFNFNGGKPIMRKLYSQSSKHFEQQMEASPHPSPSKES